MMFYRVFLAKYKLRTLLMNMLTSVSDDACHLLYEDITLTKTKCLYNEQTYRVSSACKEIKPGVFKFIVGRLS